MKGIIVKKYIEIFMDLWVFFFCFQQNGFNFNVIKNFNRVWQSSLNRWNVIQEIRI